MDNRSIGVFDSGIGGLTVVKELTKILPNEKIVYFGDTARVPYGTRSEETIKRFSKECIEFLNQKDITISSEGNVIFDAKGRNLHFEVTGDNILIEKITFRNFNFTADGGAILWNGNYGTLKNCKFINNTARYGAGAI